MTDRLVSKLSGGARCIAALLMFALGIAALPAVADETGAQGGGDAPLVLLTDIEGAIGPPATRQITTLIAEGEERGAELVILRLDTPGGLTTSTRDINKAILAATVPVAVYVAPPGARAASAGTYILYASHVAAMAEGTNLGAATPVQMGGGGPPGLPGGEGDTPGDTDGQGDSAGSGEDGGGEKDAPATPASNQGKLANKAVNDAVAQIRSLAELRGRNGDWAERAVREGASLPASEARENNVIEFVAEDVTALLDALDGHEVTIGETTRALSTADARLETREPSLVTRILAILSNPNVALLLMTIGFYGLIFELSSPGLGPGIPGVICLLLGLYSLNLLPIDYAGLALIGLGLALMAAEAVTPAFGVLGLGGGASFAIGAAMLMNTDVPAYQISWGVIAGITILSMLVVTFVVGAIWRTRGKRDHAGAGAMIGTSARVEDWQAGQGHVRALGERWNATGPDDLHVGERVEIARVDGLTLSVARPAGATETREAAP